VLNPCGNWEKSTLEAVENKFDINAKCQLNLISFFIFLKLINVNGYYQTVKKNLIHKFDDTKEMFHSNVYVIYLEVFFLNCLHYNKNALIGMVKK
jgi:hypothetical protein